MINQQRFRKVKTLLSEAKKLLEPIKDDLMSEHEEKYELRYSDSDPLPKNWEYCQELSKASNRIVSMIVDLEELEQTSVAIPL